MKKNLLLFFLLTVASVILSGSSLFAQNQLTKDQIQKLDGGAIAVLNKEIPELNLPVAFLNSPVMQTDENNVNYYDFIVYMNNPSSIRKKGYQTGTSIKNWITVRASAQQILEILQSEAVTHIKTSPEIKLNNDETRGESGVAVLQDGINGVQYAGQGVLVGVLDSGIDYTHLDFRDPNNTAISRIAAIWDATITADEPGEETPADKNALYNACCGYGIEYTNADINDEIDGFPANFVETVDINGHGTHVAGTAAGNGAAIGRHKGMAPESELVIVKGGNGGFSTNNIVNGLNWLALKSQELGKPIVVNMSLGGHINPHDGTSISSQATDAFFSAPGRIAVAAAGNEGGINMHNSGTATDNAITDIDFTINGYAPAGGAQNDYALFLLYFDGDDDVTITVTSPNNIVTTVLPGEQKNGGNDNDGTLWVENVIDPNNGDRFFHFQLFDANPAKTPAPGAWKVQIDNPNGGDDGSMVFHQWMYANTIPTLVAGADNAYQVSSPATASSAIATANYTHRIRWSDANFNSWAFNGIINDDIAPSSSRGPRRDDVLKPEIANPGQVVTSALSSDAAPFFGAAGIAPGGVHQYSTGTSMASPGVAGGIALLLQEDPTLDFNEVKSLIMNNARLDAYTGGANNPTWGSGKFDVSKAMIKLIDPGSTPEHEILSYDEWTGVGNVPLLGTQSAAVRFTPNFTGEVAGVFFHMFANNNGVPLNLSAPIRIGIYDNNGGEPGNLLQEINYDNTKALKFSWNYISFGDLKVDVTNGTDYFVVLSLTNQGGDDWGLYAENGNVDNRSYISDGGPWVQQAFDFKIRPQIIFGDNVPLPVELVYFSGDWLNNDVLLKWGTAFEEGASHFIVERSTDGEDFTAVGEIVANGNANTLSEYEFTDKTAISSVDPYFYYRLKQVDINQEFVYSNTIVVHNTEKPLVESVYPNPAVDILTIQLSSDETVKIEVIDLIGQPVLVSKGKGTEIELNVSKLAAGQYLLKIIGQNGESQISKFIKQ